MPYANTSRGTVCHGRRAHLLRRLCLLVEPLSGSATGSLLATKPAFSERQSTTRESYDLVSSRGSHQGRGRTVCRHVPSRDGGLQPCQVVDGRWRCLGSPRAASSGARYRARRRRKRSWLPVMRPGELPTRRGISRVEVSLRPRSPTLFSELLTTTMASERRSRN